MVGLECAIAFLDIPCRKQLGPDLAERVTTDAQVLAHGGTKRTTHGSVMSCGSLRIESPP